MEQARGNSPRFSEDLRVFRSSEKRMPMISENKNFCGYHLSISMAIGNRGFPAKKLEVLNMRKFLIEMEQEITLEELRRDYYEQFEDTDAETFERYLELCMWWNNGALTEILTDETPRGLASRAVGKFCPDGETEIWLPMSKFPLFS